MKRPAAVVGLILVGWLLSAANQVDARLTRRLCRRCVPANATAKLDARPGITAKSSTAREKARLASARVPRNQRWPAEFETQGALLLGCHQLLHDAPQAFVDIAAATQGKVALVALIGSTDDYRLAHRLLEERGVTASGIHFLELPHDSMWARDYGPLIVEQRDGTRAIYDADYSTRGRPHDDAVPLGLARHLKLPVVPVPHTVDGGNLLSNGRGMGIATYALLERDRQGNVDEHEMRATLQGMLGITELVFLEPLSGEPTGHVDMFATLVAPDTVVVGRIDPLLDAENAGILDRNAARLAAVPTAAGPLRVVRIPMPARDDKTWRTYTNVAFANGVLLVPSYPGGDSALEDEALATYARLLPGWRIAPIDARALIACGGALHCLTMNLPGIGPLPSFPPPMKLDDLVDEVLAGAEPWLTSPRGLRWRIQ